MKKILKKIWLLVFVALSACSINEEYFAPKITLDNESGIYTVKYGREIIIKPTYEH
ncbi:MAG: hypothetical protein IIV21_07590, partial [Bacteroidales bacterium]|nr:hypothetical protein [Bacteroidales bacterium]